VLDRGDGCGLPAMASQGFEQEVSGGEMVFIMLQDDSTWRESRYDSSAFRAQVHLKE
jgi:hypothetical protein